MSTFPVDPPVTPAASTPEDAGAANRRELSQEEIATLPLQALLVRAGHITLDQLADALRENVATGRSVEDIALSRGWLSAAQLDALRAAKQNYAPGAPAPVAQPPAAPAPAPAPAPVVEAHAPPPPPPVVEAPAAPMPVYEAPAPPPAPVVQAPPPAPAPEPAPVAQAPAPAPAPAPVVEAPSERASAPTDTSVGVFLNLEDGARIWAGRFDSLEEAEQHAQNLTESLVRPEPGVWPRFGDQLVRPDAVVSVEVSPREER
jgi:Meckel syndrome type 1 protein